MAYVRRGEDRPSRRPEVRASALSTSGRLPSQRNSLVETYGFVPILATVMTTPDADLRARLAGLMLRDERRLGRRLDGLRKIRDAAKRAAATATVASAI